MGPPASCLPDPTQGISRRFENCVPYVNWSITPRKPSPSNCRAGESGPTPGSGTRGAGRLLLFLLDELALDKDLDLVADDPLAIEHHVERQAEVLAVDLSLSTVTDAVAHHGIIEFPVLHYRKRYRPGVALDGQVASHLVAILSGLFDSGAFEGDRRVLVDFQKIRRAQVVIALGVVGAETGRLDGDLHRRRFGVVRIDVAGRGEFGKVSAHRHHAQVLGSKLDLRVIRVKLPATLGSGLCFILRCHSISSIANEIARLCLEKNSQSCSFSFQVCAYFMKVSIYSIVPIVKDIVFKWGIWYTCAMTTPDQVPTTEQAETCATHPVGRALRLLGDAWTLIIVYTLLSGTKRFGELLQAMGNVSPKTLSQRLKMLEEMGFVQRQAFLEIPPRVEYCLTEKGLALVDIMEAIKQFGQRYLSEVEWTSPSTAS